MPRVHVPGASVGHTVALPEEEAHHVATVLRRGIGDRVEVVGAGGKVLDATIHEVREVEGAPPEVRLRVGDAVPGATADGVPWTVAVAPVKEKSFDIAVRLASELGLERLIPLRAERGQVQLVPSSKRAGRWLRIAAEAAKQSGRARPVEVGEAAGLEEVVERARQADETVWIATPGGPAPTLDALLGATGQPGPSLFLIGPEGGFSPAEVATATAAGARPLGFPTPVLRTPTAIALVAALGALARWDSLRSSPGFGGFPVDEQERGR